MSLDAFMNSPLNLQMQLLGTGQIQLQLGKNLDGVARTHLYCMFLLYALYPWVLCEMI
jgi:hypothetical protein